MTRSPARLALVALPFEASTSFLRGTISAPFAILQELDRIDNFDLALGRDPFDGVSSTVVRPHGTESLSAEIQQTLAARAVTDLLDRNVFPLGLGGEHTVSLGPIRAAKARGELGVVQLDAHADLRNEYEGNRFSHACVMRRVFEAGCPILGIGIRATSREEAAFVRKQKIPCVSDREAAASDDWYRLLQALPRRVYLTVDMDVFDPFDVPAVGTPEPGGLGWNRVCDFLKHLFAHKEVVAADMVELKPGRDDRASVRLAARLAGLITGLRFSPG